MGKPDQRGKIGLAGLLKIDKDCYADGDPQKQKKRSM